MHPRKTDNALKSIILNILFTVVVLAEGNILQIVIGGDACFLASDTTSRNLYEIVKCYQDR